MQQQKTIFFLGVMVHNLHGEGKILPYKENPEPSQKKTKRSEAVLAIQFTPEQIQEIENKSKEAQLVQQRKMDSMILNATEQLRDIENKNTEA